MSRVGPLVKTKLGPDVPLPSGFLDSLRARTPLAAVIGRRVRLARSGRQWKGCCPFHGEKTPSFYVYDDHFPASAAACGDLVPARHAKPGRRATGGRATRRRSRHGGASHRRRRRGRPPPPRPARRPQELPRKPSSAASACPKAPRPPLPARPAPSPTKPSSGFRPRLVRRSRDALAADLARENVAPDMLIEAGLMRPAGARPASVRLLLQWCSPSATAAAAPSASAAACSATASRNT